MLQIYLKWSLSCVFILVCLLFAFIKIYELPSFFVNTHPAKLIKTLRPSILWNQRRLEVNTIKAISHSLTQICNLIRSPNENTERDEFFNRYSNASNATTSLCVTLVIILMIATCPRRSIRLNIINLQIYYISSNINNSQVA